VCYMYEIPEVIFERALRADGKLLPKKSRPLYEKEFHKFDDWRNKNSVKTVNETVLMGYFHELVHMYCLIMLLSSSVSCIS
jgi:hypothetical protein